MACWATCQQQYVPSINYKYVVKTIRVDQNHQISLVNMLQDAKSLQDEFDNDVIDCYEEYVQMDDPDQKDQLV